MSTTVESKLVLVSYNGSNKQIRIPPEENEYEYLKTECKKLFKFDDNVSLEIFFQKYNAEWEEMVDISEEEHVISHKDKLKMVVQPTLMEKSVMDEVGYLVQLYIADCKNETFFLEGGGGAVSWIRSCFLVCRLLGYLNN